MGGETRKTGPNAGIGLSALRAYYRVDVYDVEQNKWTRVRCAGCGQQCRWLPPGLCGAGQVLLCRLSKHCCPAPASLPAYQSIPAHARPTPHATCPCLPVTLLPAHLCFPSLSLPAGHKHARPSPRHLPGGRQAGQHLCGRRRREGWVWPVRRQLLLPPLRLLLAHSLDDTGSRKAAALMRLLLAALAGDLTTPA